MDSSKEINTKEKKGKNDGMTQETIPFDLARHACMDEVLYERRCIVLFWSWGQFLA